MWFLASLLLSIPGFWLEINYLSHWETLYKSSCFLLSIFPLPLKAQGLMRVWVSVCLGCHNKMLHSSGLNTENYFSVLKARSPILRYQCSQFLLRTMFLACRWGPSHCVLTWWEMKSTSSDISFCSWIRELIHHAVPTLMTSSHADYLSKTSFLNTITSEYLEMPNGVLWLFFSLWWLPGCANSVDCYFSRLLQSSTVRDGTSAN